MANVLITGSADGLGQLTAKALVKLGRHVVLHARSEERGRQALAGVPGAKDVLIADLSNIDETKTLAEQANAIGTFDAVIHNAGLYQIGKGAAKREGLPELFYVNSLAPYILTCLIKKPKRLIYLSSGMHMQGRTDNFYFTAGEGRLSGTYTYSDTKLHNLILALAVARKWPDVLSNAVDPGWVPTKMGGAGAPDNLEKGYETQVWLAVSNYMDTHKNGNYYHHKKQVHYLQAANDHAIQDKLLYLCKQVSGVDFPQ